MLSVLQCVMIPPQPSVSCQERMCFPTFLAWIPYLLDAMLSFFLALLSYFARAHSVVNSSGRMYEREIFRVPRYLKMYSFPSSHIINKLARFQFPSENCNLQHCCWKRVSIWCPLFLYGICLTCFIFLSGSF